MTTPCNLFWFRRDLRFKDNHGLSKALEGPLPVKLIFIFDSVILDDLKNKSDKRVDFIHQALKQMDAYLKKNGSNLHILHGNPVDLIPKIVQEYHIQNVFANEDDEPYGIKRDEAVQQALTRLGVSLHLFRDHVIFGRNSILKKDGNPYTIYTPYKNAWRAAFQPSMIQSHGSEKKLANIVKEPARPFPDLADIGFLKTDYTFSPPIIDSNILKTYAETRNTPSIAGTSKLSVHLRFGTISTREAVRQAIQHSDTWWNELIWREFFIMILYHYPHVVDKSFKSKYDRIPWNNDEKSFQSWCAGKTGYPMVDAGMRELNETGFMHNRVRMVTASFLTKHLLIDWRLGEAYFAEKLLDYELGINNGNWQWSAGCGCDAAPYFRVFNPEEQLKKFDPQWIYIKKWIPEWGTAAYPKPIVEHTMARNRVLKVFKEALQE